MIRRKDEIREEIIHEDVFGKTEHHVGDLHTKFLWMHNDADNDRSADIDRVTVNILLYNLYMDISLFVIHFSNVR